MYTSLRINRSQHAFGFLGTFNDTNNQRNIPARIDVCIAPRNYAKSLSKSSIQSLVFDYREFQSRHLYRILCASPHAGSRALYYLENYKLKQKLKNVRRFWSAPRDLWDMILNIKYFVQMIMPNSYLPRTPCDKFVYDFQCDFWASYVATGYGICVHIVYIRASCDFCYGASWATRGKSVQRLCGDCTEIVQCQCSCRAVSAASAQKSYGDRGDRPLCGDYAMPPTTCLRAKVLRFFYSSNL